MSVDAALKYIVSMGVVAPESRARKDNRNQVARAEAIFLRITFESD
jgi:uncharacterized membrane protein